jgi:hypothetical protein
MFQGCLQNMYMDQDGTTLERSATPAVVKEVAARNCGDMTAVRMLEE